MAHDRNRPANSSFWVEKLCFSGPTASFKPFKKWKRKYLVFDSGVLRSYKDTMSNKNLVKEMGSKKDGAVNLSRADIVSARDDVFEIEISCIFAGNHRNEDSLFLRIPLKNTDVYKGVLFALTDHIKYAKNPDSYLNPFVSGQHRIDPKGSSYSSIGALPSSKTDDAFAKSSNEQRPIANGPVIIKPHTPTVSVGSETVAAPLVVDLSPNASSIEGPATPKSSTAAATVTSLSLITESKGYVDDGSLLYAPNPMRQHPIPEQKDSRGGISPIESDKKGLKIFYVRHGTEENILRISGGSSLSSRASTPTKEGNNLDNGKLLENDLMKDRERSATTKAEIETKNVSKLTNAHDTVSVVIEAARKKLDANIAEAAINKSGDAANVNVIVDDFSRPKYLELSEPISKSGSSDICGISHDESAMSSQSSSNDKELGPLSPTRTILSELKPPQTKVLNATLSQPQSELAMKLARRKLLTDSPGYNSDIDASSPSVSTAVATASTPAVTISSFAVGVSKISAGKTAKEISPQPQSELAIKLARRKLLTDSPGSTSEIDANSPSVSTAVTSASISTNITGFSRSHERVWIKPSEIRSAELEAEEGANVLAELNSFQVDHEDETAQIKADEKIARIAEGFTSLDIVRLKAEEEIKVADKSSRIKATKEAAQIEAEDKAVRNSKTLTAFEAAQIKAEAEAARVKDKEEAAGEEKSTLVKTTEGTALIKAEEEAALIKTAQDVTRLKVEEKAVLIKNTEADARVEAASDAARFKTEDEDARIKAAEEAAVISSASKAKVPVTQVQLTAIETLSEPDNIVGSGISTANASSSTWGWITGADAVAPSLTSSPEAAPAKSEASSASAVGIGTAAPEPVTAAMATPADLANARFQKLLESLGAPIPGAQIQSLSPSPNTLTTTSVSISNVSDTGAHTSESSLSLSSTRRSIESPLFRSFPSPANQPRVPYVVAQPKVPMYDQPSSDSLDTRRLKINEHLLVFARRRVNGAYWLGATDGWIPEEISSMKCVVPSRVLGEIPSGASIVSTKLRDVRIAQLQGFFVSMPDVIIVEISFNIDVFFGESTVMKMTRKLQEIADLKTAMDESKCPSVDAAKRVSFPYMIFELEGDGRQLVDDTIQLAQVESEINVWLNEVVCLVDLDRCKCATYVNFFVLTSNDVSLAEAELLNSGGMAHAWREEISHIGY